MKLRTIFERNRAIRGGVIAISVFDLTTLNIVSRVVLGSGIILTKFDLRQLIRASIISFYVDTYCHGVTLNFDFLTLKFQSILGVSV